MRHETRLNRRAVLLSAVGAASTTALGAQHPHGPAATKGRIKQSIAFWSFNVAGGKWNLEQTCRIARQLGCPSVELVKGEDHKVVRKHGLTCALAQIDLDPDPPFVRGFNSPAFWPRITKVTKQAIDEAAHYGSPNVICFTGYSAKDPDIPNGPAWTLEEGADNCVAGLKQVIGYAEKKGVNLCLEILNTRDDTHPMKGHPGYQGNDTEYCIDIIKRVGSERMKLLFDVYHVQIMNGDIIRRLHAHKDYIGHVHVAGNPGRGELDNQQEINFKAVMETLVDIGYQGYVGHEYIPTRDALPGLGEAVALCDV